MSENVNIIEKALMFAIIAHSAQVRKGKPEEPAIVHPIAVAEILRCYGADRNVIAASYLHDVPEDTKFTLEDIKKNFGEDIAHLVEVASELDKSKPWEERKQNKINKMREKVLRDKLIVIADKISNIEDINRIFKEKGYKDLSAFNRGEEKQEWYYRNMYKSLITNEDAQDSLFIRLQNGIDNAFGRTMEDYFEEERGL
ncbi:MAG: bifunctional (p)ppGpp synthetase/guanosine-3',5'-bis(diphosphate) 3'-pyrophosphohydrolase [Clostridia bacterium]|nr:bifunctional (p)ppGpp synthetase/guanosine-3',5'-bis(diphosphate) 3'-pyrophosphohydrolase [Clostridia bacterium]